jgi:hypothetical protein
MPCCYRPDSEEHVCYINLRQNLVQVGSRQTMYWTTNTINSWPPVLYRGSFDNTVLKNPPRTDPETTPRAWDGVKMLTRRPPGG